MAISQFLCNTGRVIISHAISVNDKVNRLACKTSRSGRLHVVRIIAREYLLFIQFLGFLFELNDVKIVRFIMRINTAGRNISSKVKNKA